MKGNLVETKGLLLKYSSLTTSLAFRQLSYSRQQFFTNDVLNKSETELWAKMIEAYLQLQAEVLICC
jgi:hypothetical protein